jgi:putative aldouronate transport system permease protein
MFTPVLIWYVMFHYVPIYGIIMAFQDFSYGKGYGGSPFIGLKHFKMLLQDEFFLRAFRNTVIIASYRVTICCAFEIVVALALNEVRVRFFKRTAQTIMYLPHFLSWVIVGSIFITLLSPVRGILKPLFDLFSLPVPAPFMEPSLFRGLLIATSMWKSTGFGTILYMAALAGIDPELYQAASMDGANRWKQLLHVTLPGIKSTIVVLFILNLGQCLKWGFDQVFNMYNRLVFSTGDIVDTFIVRTAMADNRFSYAAAAGLLLSIISMLMMIAANKTMKKVVGHSIY